MIGVFHPRHGEDVGNSLGIVPNRFAVPLYTPVQVGPGHSFVPAEVHIYIYFSDVC